MRSLNTNTAPTDRPIRGGVRVEKEEIERGEKRDEKEQK